MFNVRLKKVRFTRAVLAISFVILIVLDASASGSVLRRNRREIIDSDSGHANGASILTAVAPTSSEIAADDVSIDRVHSLEINDKSNKNNEERVGVADISNTNSSTTSKYSQNDIIISNLTGSTTLPSTTMPSTTLPPSSTTDVNNAIATDVLDESHPGYQHEYNGAKHNQRTTATTEASLTSTASMTSSASVTASTKSNRLQAKDEPNVSHETQEIVPDKRAKFLADSSADFAATTIPSWADLKNVGEVNHNNVSFSKSTDADVAVVKFESKSPEERITAPTNGDNGSTESMNHEGGVVAESQRHMFDLKLNRNSSHIDDTVHQDISVNVLPSVTSTTTTKSISPATTTTSTTPEVSTPHTTERDRLSLTTLPEEIVVRLLPTTTEEQLSTTTDQPPYDTTLTDESIATTNALKTNETDKRLSPIVEETTKITESIPDSTISATTIRPTESIDQTTVERATEHATEAMVESITPDITMAPISRASIVQPPPKPTIENVTHAEMNRQMGNQVEKQSENSIIVETTEHGNEIETTEKVTYRTADIKAATIFDETTHQQDPTTTPLFVPTRTTTEASTTSTSSSTMMTTTTSTSTSTTTTTSTTSTTTEASLIEETPDQEGIEDGPQPDRETPDVNAMIAISISIVSVVTLILLVGFLIVMRKRQKQLSYAQRCRPLGLDDAYSLDNISVYNSVRRKSAMRTSKRAYGNAAFDDPALKNNLLTISQLSTFVQRRTSIYEEFRDVPLVTARIDEVPAGCEDKNRYANVVPLPESRVHLQRLDDDETSEYINANYVKGPKDTSHYYIACQAPMDNTIIDFWRMIWEQNSRVIIMATDLTENGIEKCAEYLPPSFVIDNHVTFGDFTITLKNREVRDKYAVSTMHLNNLQTKTWREITHLWYQWPETGTPSDETSIIAMLLEARSYLKMAAPEQSVAGTTADDDKLKSDDLDMKIANRNSDKSKSLQRVQGPLTVHCSPGTGRTGTIIACDIAIRTLEQPTRSVDIPQIVYCVRRGRASAVQTREQYEFIYKVTQMYATKLTGLNNEN